MLVFWAFLCVIFCFYILEGFYHVCLCLFLRLVLSKSISADTRLRKIGFYRKRSFNGFQSNVFFLVVG